MDFPLSAAIAGVGVGGGNVAQGRVMFGKVYSNDFPVPCVRRQIMV